MPLKQGLSKFKRSSKYLDVELNAWIVTASLSQDREVMKFILQQYKNKSAIREAQLVLFGIPTISLYNLVLSYLSRSNVNII